MLKQKQLWIRLGCIALLFGVGFIIEFTGFGPGESLLARGYEFLFDPSPFAPPSISSNGVVIVYMDEASQNDLNQPRNAPWDRALHARLLDRLTADGARAVIFDIIFDSVGPKPESDAAFAAAIKRNGRVILAADKSSSLEKSVQGLEYNSIINPLDSFQEGAAGTGLAHLNPDSDFLVRRHYHAIGDSGLKSLSWAAAEFLRLPVTRDPRSIRAERWVRYDGGPETIPPVSFTRAVSQNGLPAGFFKNKIVFVGVRPPTGLLVERRDEFRSPFHWWDASFPFMPAVEVHATILLNLLRQDWLYRPSPAAELALLLLTSILLGWFLPTTKPWLATLATIAFGTFVWLIALKISGPFSIYYPWLFLSAIQAPVGWTLSIVAASLDWYVRRRKLEAEKREAYEKIKEQAALLDKAQDAIYVHDWNGRLLFWNPAAEKLHGWSKPELAGKNLPALLNPDQSRLADPLQACLERGEWFGELIQNTKAGNQITVSTRWTLLRDANGRPASVLNISTDITEKKQLESYLLRSQRMESLGALAGGIAHDLNNVFTPILVGVDILGLSNDLTFRTKTLKTIGSSARRGADLVKQVLTFSRGTSGERKPTQIKHLVREMDHIMEETFPKNIKRALNLPNGLKPILGDPTQIHQILLNLCVNARDAMPDGGTLTIAAENSSLTEAHMKRFPGSVPGDYLLLKASDTGTGIPPEVVNRIFEPFFTTKELGKGTGLGLSTVLTIVKNHGGIIDLQTTVGKGTTFLIYLPIAGSKETLGSAETPRPVDGAKRTILLIDDESGIRELTAAMLEAEDFTVISAPDGARGLEELELHRNEIALVLLDMMMPGLSGDATLQRLKRMAPELPVITMSGLHDAMKGESNTMIAAFLAKPFNFQTLNAALEKVLSPKSTPETEPALSNI